MHDNLCQLVFIIVVVAKILCIAGVGYHLTVQLIQTEALIHFFKGCTVESLLLLHFNQEYWFTDST